MVVVRIEMWPQGSKLHRRDLAAIVIANAGVSEDGRVGSYQYAVSHQVGSEYAGDFSLDEFIERFNTEGSTPKGWTWKRGKVVGFFRNSGAVRLLGRVLGEAFKR